MVSEAWALPDGCVVLVPVELEAGEACLMVLNKRLDVWNFSCDLGYPLSVLSSSPLMFRTQLTESDEKRASARRHLIEETFYVALADRDLSWQSDLYERLVGALCLTLDGVIVPLDRMNGLCNAPGINPILDHPLREVLQTVVHEKFWLHELCQQTPKITDYAPFSPSGGWS